MTSVNCDCSAAPQPQPRVNLPYQPPPVHQLPAQVTNSHNFDPSPLDTKVWGISPTYHDNVLRYRNTPPMCFSLTSTRSYPISKWSLRSCKKQSSCWAMPCPPSIWTFRQRHNETRLMRPLIKTRVITNIAQHICFPWRRLVIIIFLFFVWISKWTMTKPITQINLSYCM